MVMLKKSIISIVLLLSALGVMAQPYDASHISAAIALKIPGNPAVNYPLTMTSNSNSSYNLKMVAKEKIPVSILQQVSEQNGIKKIKMQITALENIYFNYSQQFATDSPHNDCLFYMPGFWYRRNLRSPKEAPSFHTSDSWTVREDRLSTPLTGIFNEKSGEYISVLRVDSFINEALITHKEGEVILSGKKSIGFTGFENINGIASLSFGYPYQETPKSYIRKLTLNPSIKAFQFLKKGEHIIIIWNIKQGKAEDFADFVKQTWEYSYDTYKPMEVNTNYSVDMMKRVMSNFFTSSFVGDKPLKYYSGVGLRTDDCKSTGSAEVGFVGRILLNAFNALEYGKQQNRKELQDNAYEIFDSYLQNGFSEAGFFKEFVDYNTNYEEQVHSIRRQSEGIYAMLHFLQYEKQNGRKHPEWEKRIKGMLDIFLKLQNNDGSFPRKFKDDLSVVDKSGGSTPSATLPLVMGYKFFKNKRYLESAKRSAAYLENELISKSDYFSSTLDANCEDKEASLYAATATYYLALVTQGTERQHYASLAKKAAYFALSWYYVWDVPFAQGQMLGDIGLKTRGWGNVSVENNHIDVFVFEFNSVLKWLAREYKESRFTDFSKVIESSMKQLLPYEGNLCGVAKEGYFPEVVQHTNWDYGRNGKGFYNDIFAPGWTVASLWELFSPGRSETYLK